MSGSDKPMTEDGLRLHSAMFSQGLLAEVNLTT
jgi:hypothetical protein